MHVSESFIATDLGVDPEALYEDFLSRIHTGRSDSWSMWHLVDNCTSGTTNVTCGGSPVSPGKAGWWRQANQWWEKRPACIQKEVLLPGYTCGY